MLPPSLNANNDLFQNPNLILSSHPYIPFYPPPQYNPIPSVYQNQDIPVNFSPYNSPSIIPVPLNVYSSITPYSFQPSTISPYFNVSLSTTPKSFVDNNVNNYSFNKPFKEFVPKSLRYNGGFSNSDNGSTYVSNNTSPTFNEAHLRKLNFFLSFFFFYFLNEVLLLFYYYLNILLLLLLLLLKPSSLSC
jgi:hypothetical protein